MDYQVLVVEDNELPSGVDWLWCRRRGDLNLFVKRHAFTGPVLSRAIACRMAVEGDPAAIRAAS